MTDCRTCKHIRALYTNKPPFYCLQLKIEISGCVPCSQYKSIKEPEMTTTTDFEALKAMPGALVGKYVKHEDKKWMVYGDYRLTDTCVKYPIGINRNGTMDVVLVEQISEWAEPKPKQQKAFFTYKGTDKNIYIHSAAITKNSAEKYCKETKRILLDWPADLSKVYTCEEDE